MDPCERGDAVTFDLVTILDEGRVPSDWDDARLLRAITCQTWGARVTRVLRAEARKRNLI